MMKTNKSFLKEYSWAFLFAVCIMGIVVMAISLVDSKELPITIIGAVLGVAMTVFATFFLFKGQSRQQIALLEEQHRIERDQEYETEIFKQKLMAYQRFLDALCGYIETKTDLAKTRLKFHTAALAMHGKYSQLTPINKSVKEILKLFEGEEGKCTDVVLVPELFTISKIFREELYGINKEDEVLTQFENSVSELVESLRYSNEGQSSEQEAQDNKRDIQEIDAEKENGVEAWENFVERLFGWTVKTYNGNITMAQKNGESVIDFKMKDGYYVVMASKGDDRDVPIFLKDKFNGYRSRNIWYNKLGSLRNYRVKSGELANEVVNNDGARAVVIRWTDRLLSVLDAN